MPRVEFRCSVHVKCGADADRRDAAQISAKGLQLEGEELPALGAT